MHSGFLIALWMTFVIFVQFLSPPALLLAVAACVLVAWRFASARGLRLVKRVRFLVLAIIVLFGGFTPGEALWSMLPELSPSREGLALAAEHVGRLLCVVLCVALLMEGLPAERLVGGLHALLGPLRWIGLPTERLAVRLLLVLRYVESAPAGAWRLWLEDDGGSSGDVEMIVFARETLTRLDILVLGALLAAIAAWFGVMR